MFSPYIRECDDNDKVVRENNVARNDLLLSPYWYQEKQSTGVSCISSYLKTIHLNIRFFVCFIRQQLLPLNLMEESCLPPIQEQVQGWSCYSNCNNSKLLIY